MHGSDFKKKKSRNRISSDFSLSASLDLTVKKMVDDEC